MKRALVPFVVAAGLCGLLVAFAPGCSGFGKAVRRHTYPPDFEYVPRDQLQSTMWVLAGEIKNLDTLLRREQSDPGSQQAAIQRALTSIDAALSRIQVDSTASNHPLLHDHVPELERRVKRALLDSERQPPSYFSASTLSDSCFLCHKRGGPP